MISDDVLAGLKAYIESEAENHPVVDDLTIALRDSDQAKAYPLVVLADEGTQEHPVLRGVQAPLTVSVTVYSVLNAEGDDASGTDQATHQSYTDALFDILGDTNAVTFLNGQDGLRVFDIRGSNGTTGEEDGRVATRFELNIVCCKA